MSTTPTPAAIALPAHMQQEMEASTRVITALKVVDAGTYETAVDLGKELASGAKRIKEFFQPMKRAADEAKAAILAQEQKSLAPLEQAKAYLSGQVTAYRVEQDRIATAKRQEEEERERARIAENRRLEAAAATAAGKPKLAAAITAAPIDTPKVDIQSATPQVSGIRRTKVWGFTIVDHTLIPREFLTPDLKKIGEYAREQKEAAAIPGVEFKGEDRTHF
jgi:hypothetical protein